MNEVDPRMLQANERTLLAWIRTGLGLMAFGFVVARFGAWVYVLEGVTPPPAPSAASGSAADYAWIGAGFLGIGTASIGVAAVRFARFRKALLAGQPAIQGIGVELGLAVILCALGGLLSVYILARR